MKAPVFFTQLVLDVVRPVKILILIILNVLRHIIG